ncbi:MAG TPA: hypothetical protein VMZ11_04900 [Mycobacteriales bacterium]|nr:hypothetical protein [Mycobacteriales bacterium]
MSVILALTSDDRLMHGAQAGSHTALCGRPVMGALDFAFHPRSPEACPVCALGAVLNTPSTLAR